MRIKSLINKIRMALYESKESGRNRVTTLQEETVT